ncbi:MAG: hypothetical protein AB7U43_00485 [Desulfobacter sp.]
MIFFRKMLGLIGGLNKTILVVALISLLSFFAGAKLQQNKRSIVKIFTFKQKTEEISPKYQRDNEIFKQSFTKTKTQTQLLLPCNTVHDITKNVQSMFIPSTMFFGSYANIKINDTKRSNDIINVNYSIADRKYSAYCFYKKTTKSNNRNAVLIIPGTGLNQSTDIFHKNKNNYHGDILNVFEDNFDVYVYVKPNEDFLAIHDGKYKLDQIFYVNYLLNSGGSYSAHYLVNSIAFTKHLKSKYSKVIVAGLSQGGAAALLNSLQSNPDAAIIASGFSVLSSVADGSDLAQIIIPGIRAFYTNEKIKDLIQSSKTKYLFTYGKKETGTYKIEAEEGLTSKFLKDCLNTNFIVHPNGHEFDKTAIHNFILKLREN